MSLDPDHWPRYCNAILRDADGRYLLECRSIHETEAAGQLTCFGGGRERGEHPDDCIRRELIEELGIEGVYLERCVILSSRADGRAISWFYRGQAPDPTLVRPEPGVIAAWHTWDQMLVLPVGGWNLAALVAEREGCGVAVAD